MYATVVNMLFFNPTTVVLGVSNLDFVELNTYVPPT
jgi:hypothetical protein